MPRNDRRPRPPAHQRSGNPGGQQSRQRTEDAPGDLTPQVILLPAAPSGTQAGGEALARAALDDLRDLLSEFDLPVSGPGSGDAGAAAELAAALMGDAPVGLLACDVLNPPSLLLESLFDPLEEFDAVVGPAFDGGVYGLAVGGGLEAPVAGELAAMLADGTARCADAVRLLQSAGYACFCQQPWYRMADSASVAFARAHMSTLVLTDDPDMTAERTRAVLLAGEASPASGHGEPH